MAEQFHDRVMEICTTAGTGVLTLLGTTGIAGFRKFSSVCASTDTFPYSVWQVDANGVPSGDWESGMGTYGNSTVTRTTVYESSSSNAAVNFPAGTTYVAMSQIAARTPYWSVDNDLIFPNLEGGFPSAPGNNSTAVFITELANRAFLATRGPSGLTSRLQPFMATNKIGFYNPGGDSTVVPGVFGMVAPGTAGTVSSQATATTNIYTRMRRIGFGTTGAASSQVSIVQNLSQLTTGDGSRSGGFWVDIRFGIQDGNTTPMSTGVAFVGMSSTNLAPTLGTNFGNTTFVNTFGIVQMSSFANWQMFCNGSSTGPALNLGAAFPAQTTNQGYELTMFAPATSSNTLAMTLYNINTDTYTTKVYSGGSSVVVSADTLLSWRAVKNMFSVSTAAMSLTIISIYQESDN